MTLWSGRFTSPMDEALWDLSESYSFDHVLYAHDIEGSKAHVRGLASAGLLSDDEATTLLATLNTSQAASHLSFTISPLLCVSASPRHRP